ncbi:MAG TPA: GAF domain-containing protein, partial [Candidatus Limnocylindrales bacterium]
MSTALPPRPIDATLSVTKAARVLGVHPNTVRAWSDAGRLRYYRINPRGDRRYRVGDLQRFLASAEHAATLSTATTPRRAFDPAVVSAALTRDTDRVRTSTTRGRLASARRRAAEAPDVPTPTDVGRHQRDLALLDRIARTALRGPGGIDEALGRLAREIQAGGERTLVVVWELCEERLVPRATAARDGRSTPRLHDLPHDLGVLGRALDAAPLVDPHARGDIDASAVPLIADRTERVSGSALPGDHDELAVAIQGPTGPWGVLLLVDGPGAFTATDRDLARVLADAIGTIVDVTRRRDETDHLLHRAEALRRVAGDIGSRLDLDRILSGLVDHAMVLFEADRAAVFLRRPDGEDSAEVSRGLSAGYLNAMRAIRPRTLPNAAIAARQPLFSVGYRDDPRGADVRAAVVQEGFDTICTAPLMDGTELLGMLNVYHDRPHPWSADELETIAALATQASVAIRAAQDFQRMATWTAQLQSIQQLGARLNHLSNVRDIALAIATELRQLIDYHNVRVYRLVGEDLVPVAMQGQVGEYVDETPDQL